MEQVRNEFLLEAARDFPSTDERRAKRHSFHP
jgi:hypothetical protein